MQSTTSNFHAQAFDQNKWIESVNSLLLERAAAPIKPKDKSGDQQFRLWMYNWRRNISRTLNCVERGNPETKEGAYQGLPHVNLGQGTPDRLAELIKRITLMALKEREADPHEYPLVCATIESMCRDIPGAAKIVVDTLGDASFVYKDIENFRNTQNALQILESAIKADPALLTDENHAKLFDMITISYGWGHCVAEEIAKMKFVTQKTYKIADNFFKLRAEFFANEEIKNFKEQGLSDVKYARALLESLYSGDPSNDPELAKG
jgi:hypothetical protein